MKLRMSRRLALLKLTRTGSRDAGLSSGGALSALRLLLQLVDRGLRTRRFDAVANRLLELGRPWRRRVRFDPIEFAARDGTRQRGVELILRLELAAPARCASREASSCARSQLDLVFRRCRDPPAPPSCITSTAASQSRARAASCPFAEGACGGTPARPAARAATTVACASINGTPCKLPVAGSTVLRIWPNADRGRPRAVWDIPCTTDSTPIRTRRYWPSMISPSAPVASSRQSRKRRDLALARPSSIDADELQRDRRRRRRPAADGSAAPAPAAARRRPRRGTGGGGGGGGL